MSFVPTKFDIEVNLTTSAISVTPLDSASDMDPTAHSNATYQAWNCNRLGDTFEDLKTDCGFYAARPGLGNIATRALRQLNNLSVIGNSRHASSIGEMFLSDAMYDTSMSPRYCLSAGQYGTAALNQTRDQASLLATIEIALTSLLDDTLLAFSSAEIMMHQFTTNQTGSMTVGGIRFGTKGFVHALFAVNLAILWISIVLTLWNHGWCRLPNFDYTDIKSVIIASSMGGSSIADTVLASHALRGTSWKAGGTDRVVGAISVKLESNDDGSTKLIHRHKNTNNTQAVGRKEHTEEVSPPEGRKPWKRYLRLGSAGTSPLL